MTPSSGRPPAGRASRLPAPRLPASLLLVPLVLALAAPSSASPQPVPDHGSEWATDGVGEVAFLGINALVGGLTAGVWQELSDGSFEDGFAGGALGGSVVYVGKRISAESFAGAGFLGRDVAAVGTSVVRNASDGRPLLDSLALPVGPLRLHLSPRTPADVRVEVDLRDLYWITYGVIEDRLHLEAGESLSAGAPVFQADRTLLGSNDRPVRGGTVGGGVVVLSPLSRGDREVTAAHERVHVLHHDFFYHAWFRPLEDHLARMLPADGLVGRVDYDLAHPVLRVGAYATGWGDAFDAPTEAEAEFLEGR